LLHLFPHWNLAKEDGIKEGQPVSVWVHCNADEVELFVNGVSAGRKPVVKDLHLEWSVPYAPGKIEAFAYKSGQVILKDKRETAGPAYRIALTADRTVLTADGRDVAVLRAEVFDERDVPVPHADNLIRFTITGPGAVIGVGNGNPNSLEPDKATSRKAFNSLACAILQTSASAGLITVTATADGLTPGKVVLKAV
jgi:beta-galactosidase